LYPRRRQVVTGSTKSGDVITGSTESGDVITGNTKSGDVTTGSTKSGDVIARVRATDADAGANAILTYSLQGDPDGKFSIAPETGVIRLEKNRIGESETDDDDVDRETVYHLVVVASDGGTIKFTHLASRHVTSFQLTSFHLNRVWRDWSQPR